MLEVHNNDTRTMSIEVVLEIFIVNFEIISGFHLMFPLLTLNK